MKQVTVLQHLATEGLGILEPILNAAGISIHTIHIFAGEKVPAELGTDDGLIVLGGPVSVYESEKYPYLINEIRLIETVLQENKPILGICLGSQLLASALGANIIKSGQQEIGWFPVTLSEAAQTDVLWNGVENEFMAYHWHGDVFNLPEDAVSLASSMLTEHQAFTHKERAYGILFHPEATKEIIWGMTQNFAEEAEGAGVTQKEILEDSEKYLLAFQAIADKIFNRWVKLID